MWHNNQRQKSRFFSRSIENVSSRKEKNRTDLSLTMHTMVASKRTKDLKGTETRLAGKRHRTACWETLCWPTIRERRTRVSEMLTLHTGGLEKLAAWISLVLAFEVKYFSLMWNHKFVWLVPQAVIRDLSPLPNKDALPGDLKERRRMGKRVMSCVCHSLYIWLPAVPRCSLCSRGRPQSPVQSPIQLSPVTLDMVQPLHQVLSLPGSSRAHTYSTYNVEKEENGNQYSFIVAFNSAWQCPTVRLTCGYLNKLCGFWM